MLCAAALVLSFAWADAETCAAGRDNSAEHQAALLQRGVQAGPNTLAHSLERLILPALESHLPITLEQQPSDKQGTSDDMKAAPADSAGNTSQTSGAKASKVPDDGAVNASDTAGAKSSKAADDAAGNTSETAGATGSKAADDAAGNTSETAGATGSKVEPNDGAGNASETGAKSSNASNDAEATKGEKGVQGKAGDETVGDAGRELGGPAKNSEDGAVDQRSAIPDSSAEPAVVGERIAPFGKEDTAQELQDHAARTQDTLVDAIENAEVAEIKRSVFRTLTRLRAASIKEFDTIARMQTEAIDDYNDAHHYRGENPLEHLHSAEPAVTEDKYYAFH